MQLKCKLVEVATLNYVVEQNKTCKTTNPIKLNHIPFPSVARPNFTFIDLFAGIGGFRIAMQEKGGECVFSSEWDTFANKTYEANFGEVPSGDIREIIEENIPDHDVLCAGFPCQPFSLAGISARNSLNTANGFACETQGTLFFDVVRIINAKKPKIVFLENVKNIVRHDDGKTFSIIRNTIESLGYSFSHGNSVVIPVIRKIAEHILPYLEAEKTKSSTLLSNLLISKSTEEVLL